MSSNVALQPAGSSSREWPDLHPTRNTLVLHNGISWDAGSAKIPEFAHSQKNQPTNQPTYRHMCKQRTLAFVISTRKINAKKANGEKGS